MIEDRVTRSYQLSILPFITNAYVISLGDHSIKCRIVALGKGPESEKSFFARKCACFLVELIVGDIRP